MSPDELEPLARLRRRLRRLGAPLCAGIDPHPDNLPPGYAAGASALEAHVTTLVEAVAEHVVAVKFNLAFFEAFGSAGWRALERARASVPAEIFVIMDAKRGDIARSAERYAEAMMGVLRADAVTLSPYLGEDAIEPFLAFPGRAVYLLARTSNPSASTLQDLPIDGRPLHRHVARWAAARWTDGRVGLVVGATRADELTAIRREVPNPPFLVPGVGAQGGDLETALRTCHGASAPGLISVSRGISTPPEPGGEAHGWDPAARAAAAAAGWRRRMLEAGATLPP